MLFLKLKRLLLLLFALATGMVMRADNIYIMNAPGYNIAGAELIDAMESLGHTVTVNSDTWQVYPDISSACVDPNGYHWLCFFGEYDFSYMWPDVLSFVADGGKVYYNYEVTCCTQSAIGAAAMVANITGLPVTVNANDYIAFGGGSGGWIANLSGCIDVTGAAYKGLDGLPVANQLQADAVINGASPDVSVCPNFGYFFTGAEIPGNTLNGSITGMGDINVWYDGGEPWSNGGTDPVNIDLVAYFFPNESTTCNLATSGCENDCPFGNVLGPDLTICENEDVVLDATHPNATGYLWQDNSVNPTLTISQGGTYYVEVTDGTVSCTDTIHVEEIIVSAVAASDITICQGLSATLSASGGDTYAWTPEVSLSDATSQNPEASPSVTTTYTVTATVGQCSDTDEVTVTVVEAEVDFISFITPQVCEVQGGVTISQVTGGTGPYDLTLDNVAIQSDETIALSAGTYELVIVDQIGCSLTEELIVADESYDLILTSAFVHPYCEIPGSIEITGVEGANGSVEYTLNGNAEPDGVFSDLVANNYDVLATDDQGCQGSVSVALVFDPGSVFATTEVLNPICLAPGEIAVTSVDGALAPWAISLNNNFELDGIFVGLAEGTYDLQIVDANGCLFNQQITLEHEFPQLTAVIDSLPMICETPGLLHVVDVTGGVAPFEVLIDEEIMPEGGAAVDSSWHTILVTDINGCVLADTVQVGFMNHTEAIFTADPYLENIPFDVNTDNTSLNATAYEWYVDGTLVDSTLNASVTFLEPGEFKLNLVAIDEVNGCVDSMHYIIYAKPQNALYIPNAFTPDNDGINDIFFLKGENIDKEGFEFMVFNRYGDVVWNAKGPDDVWTGEYRDGEYYVATGVYSYILRFKYLGSFDLQKVTGHITVLR
jgi:gliding motility-associated-like protein